MAVVCSVTERERERESKRKGRSMASLRRSKRLQSSLDKEIKFMIKIQKKTPETCSDLKIKLHALDI